MIRPKPPESWEYQTVASFRLTVRLRLVKSISFRIFQFSPISLWLWVAGGTGLNLTAWVVLLLAPTVFALIEHYKLWRDSDLSVHKVLKQPVSESNRQLRVIVAIGILAALLTLQRGSQILESGVSQCSLQNVSQADLLFGCSDFLVLLLAIPWGIYLLFTAISLVPSDSDDRYWAIRKRFRLASYMSYWIAGVSTLILPIIFLIGLVAFTGFPTGIFTTRAGIAILMIVVIIASILGLSLLAREKLQDWDR